MNLPQGYYYIIFLLTLLITFTTPVILGAILFKGNIFKRIIKSLGAFIYLSLASVYVIGTLPIEIEDDIENDDTIIIDDTITDETIVIEDTITEESSGNWFTNLFSSDSKDTEPTVEVPEDSGSIWSWFSDVFTYEPKEKEIRQEGTEKYPYLLSTQDDLDMLSTNPSSYFKLVNDIDYGNKEWSIIPEFTGTFDGNGYKLSNVTITDQYKNDKSYYIGLFAVSKGIIKNLSLDVTVSTENTASLEDVNFYIGGLVGLNHGTLEHINVTSTIEGYVGSNVYVGGIVGKNDYKYLGQDIYHTTTNLQSESTITFETGLTSYIGGIVGYQELSQLNDTYSNSSITVLSSEEAHVGGIVGYSRSKINNANSTGQIHTTATEAHIGGIAGHLSLKESDIFNLSSTMDIYTDIQDDANIGGLIGYAFDTVLNDSYSDQDIEVRFGKSSTIGGLVGRSTWFIERSYSHSNITAYPGDPQDFERFDRHFIGGLTGDCGRIFNSYSTGRIEVTTQLYNEAFIGGISGFTDNLIDNTYSTSTIIGHNIVDLSEIAGIVPFNNGTIRSSISMVSIQVDSSYSPLLGRVSTGFSDVENSFILSTNTLTLNGTTVEPDDIDETGLRTLDNQSIMTPNWFQNTLLWDQTIWSFTGEDNLPDLIQ